MRINYYMYNFQDVNNLQSFDFNISQIIENSTNKKAKSYVTGITYNDEKLYLIKLNKNFYLFVQTKNQEIVKAVEDNRSGLSAADLTSKLAANESMGFASYIYMNDKFSIFAFASRVLSPTSTAYAFYVEQLLKGMKVRDLSFKLIPVKTQITKAQVANLDFIGRTSFQVAYGPFVQNVLNAFNGEGKAIDFEDIAGLEVIIKPKRGKAINKTVLKSINQVPDNELEKVTLRAKAHLEDQLTNFYYSKDGMLSEGCEAESDTSIAEHMKATLGTNSVIQERIRDYKGLNYEKLVNHPLIEFNSLNHWSG
ncbi:hypothetical protein [Acinetobacter amyesii]|uniref:hypothetical protein n=1 Tax=Acinetobacter amyesii TaxID=2942470 RepID=UPI0024C08609|nr:hypothetical protein [Acinetobacter amyesii]